MDKIRGYNIAEDTDYNLVNEPALAYEPISSRYQALEVILGGGTTRIRSDVDMILLSREGLDRRTLDAIASKLHISLERLSYLLHISYRTVLRKKEGDHLSVHVSEQVLTIAEVIRRGVEVLGSEDDFATWVHADLPGLDFQKPIDYLDTSFGAAMLLKILGRIEHGVY